MKTIGNDRGIIGFAVWKCFMIFPIKYHQSFSGHKRNVWKSALDIAEIRFQKRKPRKVQINKKKPRKKRIKQSGNWAYVYPSQRICYNVEGFLTSYRWSVAIQDVIGICGNEQEYNQHFHHYELIHWFKINSRVGGFSAEFVVFPVPRTFISCFRSIENKWTSFDDYSSHLIFLLWCHSLTSKFV